MKLIVFYFLCWQIAEAKTLQVMSYNVENLFDAHHDLGKKDWTFLPKNNPLKKSACFEENKRHRKSCFKSDWNEQKVDLKISNISEVVTKGAALPDFLGLVEVENEKVVSRLAKKLGYQKFEITNSPDERGVDVALLYMTPNKSSKDIKMISHKELVVPLDYPTRNILEVEFLIDKKYPLTIFVNHWPSLSNPDSWRAKAADILLNRVKEILGKNPHMAILAMGDFNSNQVHFSSELFTDIGRVSSQNSSRGTYYFAPKDEWSSLDHFFVAGNLLSGRGLNASVKSFEIYSPSFLVHPIKKKSERGDEKNMKIVFAPKRFNPNGKSKKSIGYSDHFPIRMQLVY